jgi:serine O-acetyltransferase
VVRRACNSLVGSIGLAADTRPHIVATIDRDPASDRYLEPLLYFKGFRAIQTQRLAHWLWQKGCKDVALNLQSRSSAVFTWIGRGIFLDHATGLVVGEAGVIEDGVSMLQDVTLAVPERRTVTAIRKSATAS